MTPTERSPDTVSLGLFVTAVVVGAGNFIAVSFSNEELDPFWGAGVRFCLAALTFIAIAVALRLRWPRGRDLWLTAAFGLLSITIFYALMYWALVRVSAGLAAVVLAVVPLATLLLAAAEGQERIGLRSGIGALLACAGILWIALGPGVELPFTALVAMLLAAGAVAQSVILGKQISGNHPAMTNAVAMSVGGPVLLVLSVVFGETWSIPHETDVIIAVVYLVTIGSVGLFVLILLIVRRWTASATSYLFVLFPVMTIALDAIFRSEPITMRALTGAVVVMIGVWLGVFSPRTRRHAEEAASGADRSSQT